MPWEYTNIIRADKSWEHTAHTVNEDPRAMQLAQFPAVRVSVALTPV